MEDGIGTALKFDGKDDYVDGGSGENLEIKKQISLEAWIYPIDPTSGVGEPLILGKGIYSYGLAYNPGTIWFYISDGAWNCVAEVATKKWTHVVGTYDGRQMRLYINGRFHTGYVMDEPGTRIKDPQQNWNPQNKVFVGRRLDAHFCGMIDNTRIYDRALSDKEVEAHYSAEKKLVKKAAPLRREALEGFAREVFDIGESRKTLLVKSKETVDADLIVPSNVTLRFEEEGSCKIDKGATLTVEGAVEAPVARVFYGSGKVVFGRQSVEKVYPQWWGAVVGDGEDDTTAIQAAIGSQPIGGVVYLPRGRYEISSTLKVHSNVILKGALGRATLHAAKLLPAMIQRPDLTPPPDGIHFNATTRVDGAQFYNLNLVGEGSRIGLDFTNMNYMWIENVTVSGCGTGILLAQLGMYNTLINPIVARCDTGIEANIGVMNNNIFGGILSVVNTGIRINTASQLNIYGMTFDLFRDVGLDVDRGDHINLHYPWFDSVAPAVPVKIGPSVNGCTVVNPRFSGPTPKIIDDQSQGEAVVIVNTHSSAKGTFRAKSLETQGLYTSGLSGTDIMARNLRGQAEISGSRSRVEVRFPTPESDEEYFVTATVVSFEGNPPPGARTVYITEKSSEGFNIHLQEVPGDANSVRIDWILVR